MKKPLTFLIFHLVVIPSHVQSYCGVTERRNETKLELEHCPHDMCIANLAVSIVMKNEWETRAHQNRCAHFDQFLDGLETLSPAFEMKHAYAMGVIALMSRRWSLSSLLFQSSLDLARPFEDLEQAAMPFRPFDAYKHLSTALEMLGNVQGAISALEAYREAVMRYNILPKLIPLYVTAEQEAQQRHATLHGSKSVRNHFRSPASPDMLRRFHHMCSNSTSSPRVHPSLRLWEQVSDVIINATGPKDANNNLGLEWISSSPRVALVRNMLSTEERRALMELAEPRMVQSKVRRSAMAQHRVSSTAWVDDSASAATQAKACNPKPVALTLQVYM